MSFTTNGKGSSPVPLTCVICAHCVCLSTLVPLMYVMIVYLYEAHLWDKGSYSTDKGLAERGFVLARRAERCRGQLEWFIWSQFKHLLLRKYTLKHAWLAITMSSCTGVSIFDSEQLSIIQKENQHSNLITFSFLGVMFNLPDSIRFRALNIMCGKLFWGNATLTEPTPNVASDQP